MPKESNQSPYRWASWLLALLIVGGIALATLHWGDVRKFTQLLATAKPLWLLGALGLQFLTYVSQSAEWSLALRAGGKRRSIGELLPVAIIKLFADQAIPTAGMSGNMVLVDRLTALGVRRELAVAAVILSIVAYYASFALCAVAAVILLWLNGRVSAFVLILVTLFLCVAAAIPAGVTWVQRKGRSAVPGWLKRFDPVNDIFELIGDAPRKLVGNRRLVVQLSLLNGSIFVLDVLTLQFCLFALGQSVPIDAAFVPLVLASIVVVLGPIPLGLGSFEASSVSMLRVMGVPFEAALSATLLLRGFTLWLPLILGMALARQLRRG